MEIGGLYDVANVAFLPKAAVHVRNSPGRIVPGYPFIRQLHCQVGHMRVSKLLGKPNVERQIERFGSRLMTM
ncbi:hypothetical protein V1499_20310 [Neobacillus sp. SCS-31]|uniref:hypothetical protein n=1 Tax=Neobacillus oceani TaxID=3115292 RepID=UPI0039065B8B